MHFKFKRSNGYSKNTDVLNLRAQEHLMVYDPVIKEIFEGMIHVFGNSFPHVITKLASKNKLMRIKEILLNKAIAPSDVRMHASHPTLY